MKHRDIIRNSELFRKCSDREMDMFISLGEIRELSHHDVLFHEGFSGDRFYILLEGSIKLIKTDSRGREAIIKFIQPGEIFAEGIIFETGPYPASAVAISRSAVFGIPCKEFCSLLESRPIREDFIMSLFSKMFYLTSRIQYLSLYDVEERLFRFLLERYGEREEYTVTLPKSDIATAIGTVPETLSRIIARLKNQGDIIVWKQGKIRLRKDFWLESDYRS